MKANQRLWTVEEVCESNHCPCALDVRNSPQGSQGSKKKSASRAPKPADLVKISAMEGVSLPSDVTAVAALERRVVFEVHIYNRDEWNEAKRYALDKVKSVDINDHVPVVGFETVMLDFWAQQVRVTCPLQSHLGYAANTSSDMRENVSSLFWQFVL